MLYTVNMLNRFNATSLSLFAMHFFYLNFFNYFLAPKPIPTCWAGQAR